MREHSTYDSITDGKTAMLAKSLEIKQNQKLVDSWNPVSPSLFHQVDLEIPEMKNDKRRPFEYEIMIRLPVWGANFLVKTPIN